MSDAFVPLSAAEIRNLLKEDRDVGRKMRHAIARSLTIDALTGLVPHRLRQAVAEHRWPVNIVGLNFDE